jgi:hypothetical protein
MASTLILGGAALQRCIKDLSINNIVIPSHFGAGETGESERGIWCFSSRRLGT